MPYCIDVADILYISKPIAPPWNDSGKNLVYDLARTVSRHRPSVMTRKGSTLEIPGALLETVYPPDAGGFAPGLINNARVLGRLMTGKKLDLWHFFFAPNLRSSQLGRLAKGLRRVKTVHTIASAPAADAQINRVLFADVSVLLSRHTEKRMLDAGVAADRLVRIPPAVTPLPLPTEDARIRTRESFGLPLRAPLIVYPGDLEFGGGAELMIEALGKLRDDTAHLVMACRAKTASAGEASEKLKARVTEQGLAGRVTWTGETRGIHALLSAADVVALPSRDLYAKMDYPLVLLEAMSLARPVIVAKQTPAQELAEQGGAISVDPRQPAELVASLDSLLANAQHRASLGEAARALATAEYSPPKMAAAYEDLYDRLLAKP